jgi:CubicO group peptidase (beta-lactamase class C family)
LKRSSRVFTAALIVGSLSSVAGCGWNRETHAEDSSLALAAAESLEQALPGWLSDASVPGAAVAVVDDRDVVWEMTHGQVDSSTIFSIQSMSKSFTALAVLMAVQDGLVDLDTPIAEYLPDFTVNSVFDEHPERVITLRHLLAHRAGFTHEAPFGSNFDDRYDFTRHIESISYTWMRYPVGNRWAYANLGYDLAGYILQVRSGMPFESYVKEKVLDPLGMTGSSLDMEVIEASDNRATGHSNHQEVIPLRIPMIPAGGVYSNVRDMGRYLQFHINKGVVNGHRILRADLMEEMHTIQFAAAGQRGGYALGLLRDPVSDSYNVYHSGGGYGFQSDMAIYPEKGFAVVLLTNLGGHSAGGWRLRNVLDELVEERDGPTPVAVAGTERMIQLTSDDPRVEAILGRYGRGHEGFEIGYADEVLGMRFGPDDFFPLTFFDDDGELVGMYGSFSEIRFLPPILEGGRAAVTTIHRRYSNPYFHVYDFKDSPTDPPGPNRPHWSTYVGEYELLRYGEPEETVEITVKNGYLYYDDRKCTEHETGLFFVFDGQVLDLRSEQVSMANMPLRFTEPRQ